MFLVDIKKNAETILTELKPHLKDFLREYYTSALNINSIQNFNEYYPKNDIRKKEGELVYYNAHIKKLYNTETTQYSINDIDFNDEFKKLELTEDLENPLRISQEKPLYKFLLDNKNSLIEDDNISAEILQNWQINDKLLINKYPEKFFDIVNDEYRNKIKIVLNRENNNPNNELKFL